MAQPTPGLFALLGSGETAPAGGQVYDRLVRTLTAPPSIALMETPAGFQPNAARVAGKIADYLQQRLGHLRPKIVSIPARKRDTPESPDAPEISAPLRDANIIFLGPGSPTYAIKQLRDSLAYQRLLARQRRGAAVVAASAAAIALSAYALPVYEIYKVGEEPFWQPGLDLLGVYGLELAIVPHWNNAEGGAELDTSRCFMGQDRFAQLLALLPPSATVLGIDEHTALLVDVERGRCEVIGRGGVTVLRGGEESRYGREEPFALTALGELRLPDPADGLPPAVWAEMEAPEPETTAPLPPDEIRLLAERRQEARSRRDWAAADDLRGQLASLGWEVRDTPDGPVLEPRDP
jgi:peptidase E